MEQTSQPPEDSQPPRKYEFDDFTTSKCLGEGAFGKVLLAEDKLNNNKTYALKQLSKQYILDCDKMRHVYREKELLGILKH